MDLRHTLGSSRWLRARMVIWALSHTTPLCTRSVTRIHVLLLVSLICCEMRCTCVLLLPVVLLRARRRGPWRASCARWGAARVSVVESCGMRSRAQEGGGLVSSVFLYGAGADEKTGCEPKMPVRQRLPPSRRSHYQPRVHVSETQFSTSTTGSGGDGREAARRCAFAMPELGFSPSPSATHVEVGVLLEGLAGELGRLLVEEAVDGLFIGYQHAGASDTERAIFNNISTTSQQSRWTTSYSRGRTSCDPCRRPRLRPSAQVLTYHPLTTTVSQPSSRHQLNSPAASCAYSGPLERAILKKRSLISALSDLSNE